MRRTRIIPLDEIQRLARTWRRLKSVTATARRHRRSITAVHCALIRTGVIVPAPRPRVPRAAVLAMHREYCRPMSLNAVARLHGRTRGSLRELFVRDGLAVRCTGRIPPRYANGRIKPAHVYTRRELLALIEVMPSLHLPAALRVQWRKWPLVRRGAFLAMVRARRDFPDARAAGPYSANVVPFDYASPAAHAIAQALNAGTTSRNARIKLDLSSQGVIWDGRLWFWSPKVGYQYGSWRPTLGRPALHRVLWARAHGRPVPAGCVVRFADGNGNNLDPSNLVLATRNDLARENQAAALARKSRLLTAALLARSQRKGVGTDEQERIVQLRRASAAQ